MFLFLFYLPTHCSAMLQITAKVRSGKDLSLAFLWLSISLKDFAPAKLLCLAQVFRQRYPNQKSIKVLILAREMQLGRRSLTE